jgi:neutral ceramidase
MKKLISFSIFLLIIILFDSPSNASDKSNQNSTAWKAGVARVNITPEEHMWMAGYAFRNKPSEGKLTDLWAKALILEDAGGKRAVMISLDLVAIRKVISEPVRDRIEKQFGLTRSQVLINASHTHTGPETQSAPHIFTLDKNELDKIDRYAKKLEDQLVNLVGEAIKNLQPATLYSENGVSRFQVNRRNNNENNLAIQTELKGPNDFAVPVIKVVNAKGKIMAIAFGYACHNTVLGTYEWSGDYAGFAQKELEKRYPGVTALFFQGAGADQNPLPRRTVALAVQYGETLAASVDRVLKEKMNALTSELMLSYSEIDLKFEKASPTREELLGLMSDTSKTPDYLKASAKVLLSKLEKGEKLMTSYPYPLQVWKLGEQALVSMGGEVLVGYANELKKIYGQNLFVFGYSNDVMAYIPTHKVWKEGGYEASRSPIFTTPWASDIEEVIIREVKRLAEQAGVQKSDK